MIPWTRGKPLTWDVTIPDTFANSYIGETSTIATAAADRAAENKTTKYTDLAKTHHIVPIAIETVGAWNELALKFITELGRRISGVTQKPRETQFLFQLVVNFFAESECGSIHEHVQFRVNKILLSQAHYFHKKTHN